MRIEAVAIVAEIRYSLPCNGQVRGANVNSWDWQDRDAGRPLPGKLGEALPATIVGELRWQ